MIHDLIIYTTLMYSVWFLIFDPVVSRAVYCSLFIVHCSLFIVHCSLFIIYCVLCITYCFCFIIYFILLLTYLLLCDILVSRGYKMKLCGIIINHNSTTITLKTSDNRIHVIATRYEDSHDIKVGDTFKSDYLL